jgi:hypothetical protein
MDAICQSEEGGGQCGVADVDGLHCSALAIILETKPRKRCEGLFRGCIGCWGERVAGLQWPRRGWAAVKPLFRHTPDFMLGGCGCA